MPLAQKLTPEQEQLQHNLQQVWTKRDTSQEIKTQQTFNLVRDFIVKNPGQVTPEFAKSLSAELTKLKGAIDKLGKEYENFVVRNYHVYTWDEKDVANATQARAELSDRLERISTSLDKAIFRLERFAKSDKPLSDSDKQIFKLAPPSYKRATKEDDLQAAIEGMNVFLQESRHIQEPIEKMAKVLERVGIREENTKTFGKIIIGTSIIVSGMWMGAVLGLGMAGSAAMGAGSSALAKTAEEGLTEGKLPTIGRVFSAAVLGAALGGATHLHIAGHAIAEGAETAAVAKVAAKTGAEAAVAMSVARAGIVFVEAEGVGVASVRTILNAAREAQPAIRAVQPAIRAGAAVGKVLKTAIGELYEPKSHEYESASK